MITEAIRRGLLAFAAFSLLLAGVFREPRLPRRTAPQLSESLRPLLLPRIAFRFMEKNITPGKKNVKPINRSNHLYASASFLKTGSERSIIRVSTQ